MTDPFPAYCGVFSFVFLTSVTQMTRNKAIFCFTIGYVLFALLFIAIGYLITMPFGIGYIGAELFATYTAFRTIQMWDDINKSLQLMLEIRGL